MHSTPAVGRYRLLHPPSSPPPLPSPLPQPITPPSHSPPPTHPLSTVPFRKYWATQRRRSRIASVLLGITLLAPSSALDSASHNAPTSTKTPPSPRSSSTTGARESFVSFAVCWLLLGCMVHTWFRRHTLTHLVLRSLPASSPSSPHPFSNFFSAFRSLNCAFDTADQNCTNDFTTTTTTTTTPFEISYTIPGVTLDGHGGALAPNGLIYTCPYASVHLHSLPLLRNSLLDPISSLQSHFPRHPHAQPSIQLPIILNENLTALCPCLTLRAHPLALKQVQRHRRAHH